MNNHAKWMTFFWVLNYFCVKTLARMYLCLHFGNSCIHVYLAVLQHFNNSICVCRLGERRDEALEDGSLDRRAGMVGK